MKKITLQRVRKIKNEVSNIINHDPSDDFWIIVMYALKYYESYIQRSR